MSSHSSEDEPRETEYEVPVFSDHGLKRVTANSEREARQKALEQTDFNGKGAPFTDSPKEIED